MAAIDGNNGNANQNGTNSANNTRQAETERANAANANNIRNAADVAIASKNPYAMAAGGIVKGLDKATGGKSTQLLGKGLTQANKAMPGGKFVQNKSNKLSESGASNKIGKAASLKNSLSGKGGGGGGDDAGAQKLRSVLANRGRNNAQQRQASANNNKKASSGYTSKKEERKKRREERKDKRKKKREERKEEKEQNNDQNQSSGTSTGTADKKGKFKVTIKIIIAVIILLPFLLLFFLIMMIMVVLGFDVSQTVPAVGPSTYGTEQFSPTYKEGTPEYESEVAYYKKLEQAKKDYDKDNSDELRINFIHAFLIYKYYDTTYAKEEISEEEIKIDYDEMKEMVDKIIDLIEPKDDGNIDYSKNGTMYNQLLESSLFKDYYKDLLKSKSPEEIMDAIFDLATELEGTEQVDDTAITEETNVNVNNEKLSINDYLSDSIYARTDSVVSSEKAKAYTIAYSTNVVAANKNLSVKIDTATATNDICDINKGCSYDASGKLVTGPGEQSNLNQIYYNGGYYYRKPLSDSDKKSLDKSVNSVFGNVLVSSTGKYPTLDISKLDGFGDSDGDYKEILKKAYGSDYSFKNIGEDSYILDASYGNKKVLTNVIFYDQKDYSKSQFCGIKNYTIGGSGCGVTAMAIVASTYENDKKYDPIYMNQEAKNKGQCGYSGTSQSFFSKEAAAMKYKYLGGSKWNKNLLNSVLKHLSKGKLVIVRMGSGHFTSGGHYMVLGGIDPETKKVYVYDPNNRSNKRYRKTGNGWYSYNDIIVKEAYNFYIIEKG